MRTLAVIAPNTRRRIESERPYNRSKCGATELPAAADALPKILTGPDGSTPPGVGAEILERPWTAPSESLMERIPHERR